MMKRSRFTEERRRFGYRRLHVLLRREGHVAGLSALPGGPAFASGLAHAAGLRHLLANTELATGQAASARYGLRVLSRCARYPNAAHSTQDSRLDWMKGGEHVRCYCARPVGIEMPQSNSRHVRTAECSSCPLITETAKFEVWMLGAWSVGG
jgi:hypothetical protein